MQYRWAGRQQVLSARHICLDRKLPIPSSAMQCLAKAGQPCSLLCPFLLLFLAPFLLPSVFAAAPPHTSSTLPASLVPPAPHFLLLPLSAQLPPFRQLIFCLGAPFPLLPLSAERPPGSAWGSVRGLAKTRRRRRITTAEFIALCLELFGPLEVLITDGLVHIRLAFA